MPHRVLIPTPLRPYTGQQDAVEADGATVGDVLSSLTSTLRRAAAASVRRRRQAAALREHLRQRRRHPLSREGCDRAQVRRRHQHRPVGCRRRARVARPPRRPALPELTNDEIQRYSRHLILPEVGVEGQRKLKAGRVLCVGAGGLGSPAALYLAAAGVGTIGIIDFDTVDASNLQRQILHSTKDVGRSKLQSARDRLTALNPALQDRAYETALTSKNALEIFQRLRRHPRRHRQLLDAVSRQRCVRDPRQAERLRQHLPLRGAGLGVRDQGRTVLSLPLSGAAAARARAELRRRWRAGRAAWRDRHDPGDRDDQADSRRRLDADRTAAALRRLEHAVPRAEAAARRRLPGLRRPPDRQGADRLRPVLRHRSARQHHGGRRRADAVPEVDRAGAEARS